MLNDHLAELLFPLHEGLLRASPVWLAFAGPGDFEEMKVGNSVWICCPSEFLVPHCSQHYADFTLPLSLLKKQLPTQCCVTKGTNALGRLPSQLGCRIFKYVSVRDFGCMLQTTSTILSAQEVLSQSKAGKGA